MMNIDDEVNTPPAADEAFTTALLTSYCPGASESGALGE